jgi:hypothetical protein
MKALYGRLSELGLTRAYVRQTVLPSWWDDEAAATDAGFAEAVMLVSRHVGVDLSTLRHQAGTPSLRSGVPCKFKKAQGSSNDDVALARSLATQVAMLASSAMPQAADVPLAAAEVRALILDKGEPWVSLGALVDYCWSVGIPVLHVSNFPRSTKKMEGLTARIGGRPVIILSKEQRQPAWLLFILAHELGHVACGHVGDDQVLVDEKVEQDSNDDEERAANAYAVELLTGAPDRRFYAPGRWPNARALAAAAERIGRQHQIDPGHVVLNYGKSMGSTFFAVANAALTHLDPSPDAVAIIRRKLADNLDWSGLTEEAAEFVAKMTGLDTASLPS